MASVVIAGDVSGTCTLQAANAAGTTVLTLPTSSGVLVSTTTPLNASSITSGTLAVAYGGSGANTLTGYVKGNGTSAMTASATVPTSDLTGTLPVANGGTGATTLTANNVVLGNGTSAVQVVAPGTSGNLLTSNGTTWVSSAPSGGVTSLNGQTGAITDTDLNAIGSYVYGRPQNATTYSRNATIAGTSLYAMGGGGCYYSAANVGWFNPTGVPGAAQVLVNTGTWRCMSPAFSPDGDIGLGGLWVRIS